MNKREKEVLIYKSIIFIALFLAFVFIATQIATVMVAKGYNTIVVALPLALPFFGLGCWMTF